MTRLAIYALLLLSIGSSCASRRILTLENRVLREENTALAERLEALSLNAPPQEQYRRRPDLDVVASWLQIAGYKHTVREDKQHVHLEFVGLNTDFSVNVQIFEDADVMFLATGDYMKLADAADTDSVTLLLVQIATLNYQLLVGKFQLDPETGEVLLSLELLLDDGLGYDTFIRALEQLLHTADGRYPDLERAASGTGL